MPNNYDFIDAHSSIINAESSIISGSVHRPIVNVASVLTTVPVTFSGSPSISGAVRVIGSVIAQSIVPSSMLAGASIFGQLPAGTAVLGSVAALQGTTPWIVSSVYGNVSGSVASYPLGTIITSLVSTVPSSVLVGASIFGRVPISIVDYAAFGAPPAGNGTVTTATPRIAIASDSATLFEEGVNHGNGTAKVGAFVLGVRNDALSSIISDSVGFSAHTVGPAGETIVAVAPFTKGIQGTGDLRVVQGASVTVIAAQGASIFSYIRAAQLANMGSASVLVTFGGGLGSILSYSIAPAGGGSNLIFDPWLKTGANSAFTASISGTASVLVSAQGFIAKI